MVKLGETAVVALRDAVRQARLEEGRCLRLVQRGEEYALTIDQLSGWDIVIEDEGTSLLALSRDVSGALENAIIEAKEDEGAFQLIIRKPAEAG